MKKMKRVLMKHLNDLQVCSLHIYASTLNVYQLCFEADFYLECWHLAK